MTALNRNPQNTNPQSPNKYQVSFSRLPSLTYFCQNINLPGLSIGEIPRNTPFIDLYSPGEKLVYDSLNFSFIVDEDLKSWLEVHDWMRALTFPSDFKEYRELPRQKRFSNKPFPQFSDASLTILTAKFNANYRITFQDCFPVALSSIMFNSLDSADSIITADATFRFSLFEVEKI